MTEPLPSFAYHPDPVGTGSVEASSAPCLRCGEVRGFRYVGPVYSGDEVDGALCPWCIADGSAAAAFEAEFTDIGVGVPDSIPDEVVEELATRTPGFSAWQQERWLYHCDDAAAFLGRVGADELAPHPGAVAMIRADRAAYGWSDARLDGFVAELDAEGEATAYLFRCGRCGEHLAYADEA